jgi:hypothetical protein
MKHIYYKIVQSYDDGYRIKTPLGLPNRPDGYSTDFLSDWEKKSKYTEAFPHLLLMAFLQRVTNGHGRIEREYAAGSGRMDLAVEYNGRWDNCGAKGNR